MDRRALEVERPDPVTTKVGRRVSGVAVSLAAHLVVLAVIVTLRPEFTPELSPPPMQVSLIELQPPPPPEPPPPKVPEPAPAGPPKPDPAPPAKAPVKPPAAKAIARQSPRPPTVVPVPLAGKADTIQPGPELSDGELAAARSAGTGGGGGSGGNGEGCDMTAWLQDKLRKDPEIRSALARARQSPSYSGKPILVWNGAWTPNHGQEGLGLAGVREAIMMEVAFAPAACRAEPMRGHVLIAVEDRPGAAKLALGTGAWRWSDLLNARRR